MATKSKAVSAFDPKAFMAAIGDDDDYAIAEGSSTDEAKVTGSAGLRLNCEKDRFRTKIGSDEIQKFKKGEAVPVVIHAFAPALTQKQLFQGKYIPGQPFKPPVCWSDDGQRPASDVDAPKSPNCGTCKFGTKGSKECSYTSKLVVSFPADDGDEPQLMDMNINSGTLFTDEEDTSAGGLGMNWRNYVKFFKDEMKRDMARFISLISINTDNSNEWENQLLFRPVAPLKKGHANWELHDEQDLEELRERVRLSYADYKSTDVAGEDDDDEDEEEAPPSRSKKKVGRAKKKASAKTRMVDDEDDDDDEPVNPPAKKKSAAKRKAKPAPVEEDDDDDDDDELDIGIDDLDEAMAAFDDDDEDEDEDE